MTHCLVIAWPWEIYRRVLFAAERPYYYYLEAISFWHAVLLIRDTGELFMFCLRAKGWHCSRVRERMNTSHSFYPVAISPMRDHAPLPKYLTPWPESTSELYRPSDSRLSTKLVPTFAGRGCHVIIVTDPYGRILAFLDRSRYFFFQVAPQLYSRGWVDPVPGPLLLRKSGSAANRTRTSESVASNSDH
jgi:hypothetical protein